MIRDIEPLDPTSKTDRPPKWRLSLGCRLCWRVTLAVFLAIVAVETAVFFPSYNNFERDWLDQLERTGQASAQAAIAAAGTDNPDALLTALTAASRTTTLKGGALYSADGELIGKFGEAPERRLTGAGVAGSSERTETADGTRAEVVWPVSVTGLSFIVVARLDSSMLDAELSAFAWRISGLVAVIALAVTVATMFVLGKILLEPMLVLRTRLSHAAADPESAEQFVIGGNRRDELGDLQDATDSMLRKTSEDIRRISKGEEELRKARQDLERKVIERTQELTREVTDRRQAEEQLRESEKKLTKQANFDDLTGLPNRLLAMDRLTQSLSLADRDQGSVVLMFIDLDNFKNVNDTLGHAIGDELLVQTSRRLASCLRRSDTVAYLDEAAPGDTVARIGGDEFMVILPKIAADEHAEIVARKILAACAQPFQLSGHEVFVTASVGITIYPRDGGAPHDLMVNADTAMYEAKEAGRNAFRFFAPEMNARAIERLKIESRLRHALDHGALFLHYQPVVDIRDRQPIAAEVLLRWNDAELGNVSPERFVPVAEGCGLIIPIGEWVLRNACHEAKRLSEAAGTAIRIAVNVSTRQFRGAHFVEVVTSALEDAGLEADMLELEITESLLIEEESESAAVLRELRELGVRLSIDDFGTGYSALGYLKRFPVDTLKIDRSFVQEVTTDQENAALTRAAVAMAHSLGIEVIAEGVESEEQLAFLDSLECEYAQGYLFGKPLPAEQSREFSPARWTTPSKPARAIQA